MKFRAKNAFSPVGLYRVYGDSMLPSFLPGDIVVGWRWIGGGRRDGGAGAGRVHGRVEVGDVVVARHASRRLIKRLAAIDRAAGAAMIYGDNPGRSTDSRQFGAIPLADIEAVVFARLPRRRDFSFYSQE